MYSYTHIQVERGAPPARTEDTHKGRGGGRGREEGGSVSVV